VGDHGKPQLEGLGDQLETLVISCWVRGLSDRDVEAMLVEVFGQDATISRTTASRICQRLRAELDTWKRRDLAGHPHRRPGPGRVVLQAAPKSAAWSTSAALTGPGGWIKQVRLGRLLS
jgi:Transposase, Mutator family